jgi:hypothetical protein
MKNQVKNRVQQQKSKSLFPLFIALLVFLYALPMLNAVAQTQKKTALGVPIEDRANAGTNGIYVSFGNEILNPAKAQIQAQRTSTQGASAQSVSFKGYRVERRAVSTGTGWQPIAEVEAPSTEAEFRARFAEASKPYQGLFPLAEIPTARIWQRFERSSLLDSLGLWGNSMIVRLAVGVAYYDTSASKSTVYEYRVSKIPTSGEPIVQFITNQVLGMKPPELAPLKFMGARTDKRSITMTWEAQSSAINANNTGNTNNATSPTSSTKAPRPFGVLLLRREDLKGEFQRVPATVSLSGTLEATAYRIEDTTTRYGAIYQYYLVPFNAFAVLGQPSDTTLVSTVPFNEASFIQDVQAKGSETGIRIAWRILAASNLAGLEIWRSNDYKGVFTRIASVSPRDSIYTDRSAQEIDRYWYYLVARGLLGEVSPPSVKVFGIYEDPNKPMRPFVVEAEATENGNRVVVGHSRRGLRGFRIFRSDGVNQELLPISDVIAQDSSGYATFLDTASTLLATHSYGYAAQAESRSHQLSALSDTVYLRPNKPLPNPATPLNLVAIVERATLDSSGKRQSSSRVQLFWDDMKTIDPLIHHYRLLRKSPAGREGSGFVTLADSLGAEQNYFTDSTAMPETQYEYAVQSIGISGAEGALSPLSAIARATISDEATSTSVAAPSGVRAFRSGTGIEIRWGAVEQMGLSGYNVYRYAQGMEPQRIAQNTPDKRSFLDANAKRGQLYFYFVTTTSVAAPNQQNRESQPSREVSIRP